MSIARKHPWWVWWLTPSKALLAGILWTVLAVFSALLLPSAHLWLIQPGVIAIFGLNAVAGWASYFYYRRHPDRNQGASPGTPNE